MALTAVCELLTPPRHTARPGAPWMVMRVDTVGDRVWLLMTLTVPGISERFLHIEEEDAVRWLMKNGDNVPADVSARVTIDAPLRKIPEAAPPASGTVTPVAPDRNKPSKWRIVDARDAVPLEIPFEGSDGRRVVIQIGAKPLRFGSMSHLLRLLTELFKQSEQTPAIQISWSAVSPYCRPTLVLSGSRTGRTLSLAVCRALTRGEVAFAPEQKTPITFWKD